MNIKDVSSILAQSEEELKETELERLQVQEQKEALRREIEDVRKQLAIL
jgi:hypothetical protein